MEAPREAVLSLCSAVAELEELPSTSKGPHRLSRIELPASVRIIRILVDFCERYRNVGGRAASVELAWRKSVRPRLADSSDCAALWRLCVQPKNAARALAAGAATILEVLPSGL